MPAPAAAPATAPPPAAAPAPAAPQPVGLNLNPQLAALLANPGGIPPALLQHLLAAAAAQPAAAAAPAQPGLPPALFDATKPPFNLLEILGDTSGGVSTAQAAVLQRAIRSLREPRLAANLQPLAAMPLPQLLELLGTHPVNVREVRACVRARGCVCACAWGWGWVGADGGACRHLACIRSYPLTRWHTRMHAHAHTGAGPPGARHRPA